MLGYAAVAVALRVEDRRHTLPKCRQLGGPDLPAMPQLMSQGVPQLLVTRHPRRIQGHRIARCDVLAEPRGTAPALAHQAYRTKRAAEQGVERVGVRARGDLPSRGPTRRLIAVDDQAGGDPLHRPKAVEPGGVVCDFEQRTWRLSLEYAPIHAKQVHRAV